MAEPLTLASPPRQEGDVSTTAPVATSESAAAPPKPEQSAAPPIVQPAPVTEPISAQPPADLIDAYVIDATGHHLTKIPAPPPPGKNEFVVALAAAAVNPSDMMRLKNLYPAASPPPQPEGMPPRPCVAGFEGTGVIVAAGGGDAKPSMIGKRVAVWVPWGGVWSERFTVPASHCVELPKGTPQALGSPFVNPLTAMALFRIAHDHPGTPKGKPTAVALTAAGSTLAKMILQLSLEKKSGVCVIGLVRRTEQAEALRALGCQHVLVTESPSFETEFAETCRQLSCTLAFDAVGGSMPARLLRAMPPGSKVIVYGSLDNKPELEGLSVMTLLLEGKSVEGFHLHQYLEAIGKKEANKMISEAAKKWRGPLATHVARLFPLANVEEALEFYRHNMSAGKVLLGGPALDAGEAEHLPKVGPPEASSSTEPPQPMAAPQHAGPAGMPTSSTGLVAPTSAAPSGDTAHAQPAIPAMSPPEPPHINPPLNVPSTPGVVTAECLSGDKSAAKPQVDVSAIHGSADPLPPQAPPAPPARPTSSEAEVPAQSAPSGQQS